MWQIISCFGLIFLILEIVVPLMFFLNFALSAFICAFISLFTDNIILLTIIFCALSIVLMYTLRPLLVKQREDKKLQTGIDAKYIGKKAVVCEKIDENKGAISIYDERWQARSDEIIEEGEMVEITGHESIIMYVKKVR